MVDEIEEFLRKSEENLAAAETDFANDRFNACANRCYYACFQAAVAALQRAGIRARSDKWGHDYVGGQFAGLLINRRKLYPPDLGDVLSQTFSLRQIADYKARHVSVTEASRALRRTRRFVAEVRAKGGDLQ